MAGGDDFDRGRDSGVRLSDIVPHNAIEIRPAIFAFTFQIHNVMKSKSFSFRATLASIDFIRFEGIPQEILCL